MKNFPPLLLFLMIFYTACQPLPTEREAQAMFSAEEVKRLILVGDGLISHMEDYGFFERSILLHFAGQEVSLRNIGWPADDVYGLARSQFGSAQNTQSWQPPSAEEGFGSKVLTQHIDEADPSTLVIGYGGDVAFAKTEADVELFASGYKRLLDYAEEKDLKLILLSPPRQEKTAASAENWKERNERLEQVHHFIKEEAAARGHLFIDLYTTLITDPEKQQYTDNGLQLNRAGYEKMNEILLRQLGIKNIGEFTLSVDEQGQLLSHDNCVVSDWRPTVNGVSFTLNPDLMLGEGTLLSEEPVAIFVDGQLVAKSNDTLSQLNLFWDSLQQQRLLETIREKNRLHRYRLRPLNEAYIYLFRRHEMGHLAYEMDDLNKLVEEKEREIRQMMTTDHQYFVEIELIKPWTPPKDYPEDEVPAYVPKPNIEEELAAFHLPDGYEISLFAADPMIANPINVNWDTRGRAWVATSSTYPHIVPGREPNDKIIILEDTDGDGVADKHTVFAENLLVPHSVMPVPGGAYVTATTQLLFLADTDGDDVADERRVVYDGFGNADVHHMIHGLRWMPWGDLHFTQSIYINTFLETPFGSRILNGSGIWSFRPETERLDIFSRGLINPWGEALDQWGQSFATDGAGSSGMNYVFPESAHATAVGAPRVLDGLNNNTPKNTAAEFVYSRHFPADWQGTVITNDFRANRTVRYRVTPRESGYQSEEVQTVLRSDHRSYRPVDSKIGPDGALYIADWYNPIIDHGEVDFHHPIRDRKHGRIWKLTRKGKALLESVNFRQRSPEQLLELLKSPEQFTRIQANRAYVERQSDPRLVIDWTRRQSNAQHRLEGLWLLAALDHYDASVLLHSLQSAVPQERAAALRMLTHWGKQKEQLEILEQRIEDPHPQVRLEAIHALREMGGLQATEMMMQLLDHPMDDNLEFTLDMSLRQIKEDWLPALAMDEGLFDGDKNKQLYALLTTEDPRVIPPVNQLLNQPGITPELAEKAWLLMAKIGDAPTRVQVLAMAVKEEDAALLRAMAEAPEAQDAVPGNVEQLAGLLTHEQEAIRLQALKLAGRWKADSFSALIGERISQATERREKLEAARALVAIGKLEQIEKMARNDASALNQTVATSVWIEAAPEEATPQAVALLQKLEDPELAELLFQTFRSLENGPEILQKALEDQQIPEKIASVGLKVIQTSGLNLAELDAALRKAGSIKPIGMEMSKAEKDQLIQQALAEGNRGHGRQIYRRKELLCATCHRIDGIGGLSGPDLTTVGSYMTPNSILESILNPSTDIKQNYETVLVTRSSGEILSGLLHRKTDKATLIRQANSDIIEIPNSEISKTDVSPVSLMPIGLTSNLSAGELRDLLAYLVGLGEEG